MKKSCCIVLAACAAVLTCGALADDEPVRWYDEAQRLTWGYTVTNGEATISTPGFWDSNARDYCKGDIVVPARIGPEGPNGAVTYPVRDMKPGLFRNCKNVTSVRLPDGMRRVSDNAFYFDSGSTLTNVTIGAGCLDIGENSFCRCESLTSVNIPDTVTNIAMNAFTMCRTLRRVSIPDSVAEIGAFAFCNCDSLVEAWVPSNVVAVGDGAFASCTALETVYLPVSLRGKVREASLVDGSFNAAVRYYNPDGSLVPPPVPGPNPDVETWTVTFNPNGGELDDEGDSAREIEKGEAVGALPGVSRTGYAFAGWWTAKTKGTQVKTTTKVKKDVTYYARWTVRKYKVSAAVGSKAMGSVGGTGSKAYKSKVTLKAAPNKGYVFVMWENLDDLDTPWPDAVEYRQPSVSFTMGADPVSVRAVFAKKASDSASSLAVASDNDWYIEGDPGREIYVVADSLSYPSVSVKGQPAGTGLVRVPDTDNQYVFKVTDAAKLKPGVYSAKITSKNRSGKSVSKAITVVAPNATGAIDARLVAGLETSTLKPYAFDGGMKASRTLADLGVEISEVDGWKLSSVTGLPTGLSWNGSAIVGAATKVGVFTVTFTMKNTSKDPKTKKTKTYTSVATATFKVNALLPDELAGTYNGFANVDVADAAEGDFAPIVDGEARAVKVAVTTAGKITANICGAALSCSGFDAVTEGVYSVMLRKTQKITSGKQKGGTNVWQAYLEIDTNAEWSESQLSGWYSDYTVDKDGRAPMKPPVYVAAQRNPFALDEAKAIAAAVVASGKKGAKGFVVSKAYDEDYAYTLDCAECMVGGVKAAVTVTAKANGTVALAGTIAKTKVSGSAVLDVSPEAEEKYDDYDEYDKPIEVSVHVRTATARFFTSKFVIEVVYSLEDDEVADVTGKVWKK